MAETPDVGNGDGNDGDVWTRAFGVVAAAVVAVVGFATLSAAGIGFPLSRALFSLLLGVVAAQTFEDL
ncbi:hypothetical protein BRD09_02270 [Halobacteriales archaeon SW_10_68_16]|jgi:hypothetical protein|nr:MAG: hypothetical protein BRD09_02270 [Halobacteriales archaeon SW_10_68_16]